MRYRTSQPLVTSLVQSLKLESRPFLTVHDDNRYLLRGHHWRSGDLDAATGYALADWERGLSPGELLVAAFDRAVPGAAELADEQWIEVKARYRFRGRPLRDWRLGDLLAAVLSHEGHRYVVDCFGYATVLGDRNAADAIPWVLIEARPERENRTLVEGMEALPREAIDRFVRNGGSVEMDHELTSVEAAPGAVGSYLLNFKDRPSRRARRVVLALPAKPLARVVSHSRILSRSELPSLIGCLTASPAAKLFLSYSRAWWRDTGFAGRRTVSDLALSKTYYFDADPGAPANPALLMASYSDGPNREFWRRLAPGPEAAADREPLDSRERYSHYSAPSAMVTEAVRQLRIVHGSSVPEPVASVFMDWGTEAIGGAWHVWNAGVNSSDVMARFSQPVAGEAIYVCGEPYSSSQGWIEGALESTERVLDRMR